MHPIHRMHLKVNTGVNCDEVQEVSWRHLTDLNVFELIFCIHFTQNGTLFFAHK